MCDQAVERTGDRSGEIGVFTVFRPFIIEIDTVETVLFDCPCKNFSEFRLVGCRKVRNADALMVSQNGKQYLAAVLANRLYILVMAGRCGGCRAGNQQLGYVVVQPQSRFGAVRTDIGCENRRDVDKRFAVHTIEHRIQRVGVVDLDIHHNLRGLVTVSTGFSNRSCCIHFRLHSVLCARRNQSSRCKERT